MSRFPSFNELASRAAKTLTRFPLTLIGAAVGVISWIIIVESGSTDSYVANRIVLVAALGLPLFIALVAFGEKRGYGKNGIWGLQLIGALALTGYFFSLPSEFAFDSIHLIRFFLLNVGIHFLVAILPFVSGDQMNGFWQYNKSLFLRFLIAVLYSGVMYTGLAIALASADHLFGMDIHSELYFDLWIVIVGLFNTWVFLAGFPKSLSDLNNVTAYPKGLRVFTQYVLLPLVILYLLILYAYEIKIIVTWNWPKGWVSNLVLWFSVVGIFSLLLLHPLKERSENKWIKAFSRWFFRALIPLVVMLFLAILRRISDYGITENRYFVFVMALGLSVVVLYFIFSKIKDIRIIPIVICTLAFLSSFGPWGAFSVSLKSQQNRLERLLIKNGLWSNGMVQGSATEIPFEERKEMSSIVDYLSRWHGVESFSNWLEDDSLMRVDTLPQLRKNESIATLFGFHYAQSWRQIGSSRFHYSLSKKEPLPVSGYDYLIEFSKRATPVKQISNLGGDTLFVWHDDSLSVVNIQLGDTSRSDNIVAFRIEEHLASLRDSNIAGTLDPRYLTLEEAATDFNVGIIIDRASGQENKDGLKLTSLSARLLIRIH